MPKHDTQHRSGANSRGHGYPWKSDKALKPFELADLDPMAYGSRMYVCEPARGGKALSNFLVFRCDAFNGIGDIRTPIDGFFTYPIMLITYNRNTQK